MPDNQNQHTPFLFPTTLGRSRKELTSASEIGRSRKELTSASEIGRSRKELTSASEIGRSRKELTSASEDELTVGVNFSRKAFARELITWYNANRRDLPWRKTRDPYAIWVSEMMLQQTLVATVIPYWTRWMERFPTIVALADAPLDDVLKQWQGLGYYARARNMHRAAQVMVEKHNGQFPTRFEEVLALPGIGRYTAGAVCSIALGQDVPIVDANVIRVLCRVFGLQGDPKSAEVQDALWKLAQELIPPGKASEFNQGMMELGALICQSKPNCPSCPVQTLCYANETGTQNALPEFAPRPEFTKQTDVSAIVWHPSGEGRVLLVHRPPGGLWGGLWEFPRATLSEDETYKEAAQRAVSTSAGLVVAATDKVLGTVRHGVTTRKITLLGVECALVGTTTPQPPEGWEADWVTWDMAEKLALASPQSRLLEQVRDARSRTEPEGINRSVRNQTTLTLEF